MKEKAEDEKQELVRLYFNFSHLNCLGLVTVYSISINVLVSVYSISINVLTKCFLALGLVEFYFIYIYAVVCAVLSVGWCI